MPPSLALYVYASPAGVTPGAGICIGTPLYVAAQTFAVAEGSAGCSIPIYHRNNPICFIS